MSLRALTPPFRWTGSSRIRLRVMCLSTARLWAAALVRARIWSSLKETSTGCTVTIDAMGTQTAIAEAIQNRGADYVLAVKDNQPKLSASMQDFWRSFRAHPAAHTPHCFAQTVDKDHGRLETRRCYVFDQWNASINPASGKGCAASPCWNRNAGSATKPPANNASTSAVWLPMRPASPAPSVPTGPSRTGCSLLLDAKRKIQNYVLTLIAPEEVYFRQQNRLA